VVPLQAFGGNSADMGRAAASCAGKLFLTGEYEGQMTMSNSITAAGSSDVFVAAVDPSNGEPLWVISGGAAGVDGGHGIVCSSDTIYITGQFTGSMSFTGSDAATTTVSGQNADVFVASVTTAGVVNWLINAGGPGEDVGHGISLGASSLYVTGYFSFTAVFGSGNSDVSLTAPSGKQGGFAYSIDLNDPQQTNWAVKVSTESRLYACEYSLYNGGRLFVSGYYSGSGAFGTSTLKSTNGDGEDVVVAALNSANGDTVWVNTGGGDCLDSGYGIEYEAGKVYSTGVFCGMDVVFGNGTNALSVPEADGDDGWVAGFSAADGALEWFTATTGSMDQVGRGIVSVNTSTYAALAVPNGGDVVLTTTYVAPGGGVLFNNWGTISDAGAVITTYTTPCGFLVCPVMVTSTDKMLMLTWNDGVETMSQYETQYRLNGDSTWIIVGTSTTRSMNITGLSVLTYYDVQVKGLRVSSNSWSAFTPVKIAQTTAGRAGAPGMPYAAGKSQQWLNVTFIPSALYADVITSYRYYYAREEDPFPDTPTAAIDPGSTWFKVTSLSRYTKYRFIIQGQISQQWGLISDVGIIYTLSDPPAIPVGFSVTNIGVTSAKLNWQAETIDPNYGGGPLTNYILYRRENSVWSQFMLLPGGSSTGYTLSDLVGGVTYEFAISAKNDAAESDRCTPAPSFTTPDDFTAPSIVTRIPYHASVRNAINVTVQITFSEPVALASLTGTVTFTPSSGPSITVLASDTTRLSLNGDVLLITPNSEFLHGKMYSVLISSDLIEDQAIPPNAFPGITDTGVYTFSTVGAPVIIVPLKVENEDEDNGIVVTVMLSAVSTMVCMGLCTLCCCRKRCFAEDPEEPNGVKVIVLLEAAPVFSAQHPIQIALPSTIKELHAQAKKKFRLRKIDALFSGGTQIVTMDDLNAAVNAAKARGTRIVRVQVDFTTKWCGHCCNSTSSKAAEDTKGVNIHLNINRLEKDQQLLKQYNISDDSDGSTSTRSDAYNFRNQLSQHFARLNDDLGLQNAEQIEDIDLEAISANALKISKEALADAQKHKNVGMSVTDRRSEAESDSIPEAASQPKTSRPSSIKGAAKSKLQEALAAKRKAKADKEGVSVASASSVSESNASTVERSAAAVVPGVTPGAEVSGKKEQASVQAENSEAGDKPENAIERRRRLKGALANRVKAKKEATAVKSKDT